MTAHRHRRCRHADAPCPFEPPCAKWDCWIGRVYAYVVIGLLAFCLALVWLVRVISNG